MSHARIGIVAIGRNEGKRLEACLRSASGGGWPIVYVDSGSTDDSLVIARSLGAEVVQLDLSMPFTAARSRNAGFQRLLELHPDVEFVQFVDGDCQFMPGWLSEAERFLRSHPRVAVVCGRRREKHPEASIYNHLCDMEWDTPTGCVKACGGDAMVRVAAFQEAGGYNPEMIAGEEPELCFRLRQLGWEIHRIDRDMTLHDADMTRFRQWWKRNIRAGHAYAENYSRHGRAPEHFRRKEVISNFIWALPPMWLLWPWLWFRLYRHRRDVWYACFVTLGKIPQALGQLQYWWNRARGRRTRLIEYKQFAGGRLPISG
ncbi:MAG: glycosyltransferase [Phycisphaerae bacterium]|nr:glycosyltransferase [Phycisphaerae bacterium]MDW8261938.1 glycosyltransferase [Phycisphaerales bacterium]